MRYSIIKPFAIRIARHLFLYLAIGIAAFMASSAQAQDNIAQLAESVKGSRWALLIGIAEYPQSEGFQVQQLKAPVKDVYALKGFLEDPEKGGFKSENIFTLTDAEATRRNILINFNDIAKRAEKDDMVIFYFSGHGARLSDNETTYLIPYDHDLRDVETTCIDFDDLSGKIRKMEASKVVVILDACHSGGVKPVGARAAGNEGLVDRYLDAFQASEGRALLLSSDQSEVSWETEDSGIFTHFLLEGLNGAADKNDDGIVTFTEASAYVEETVPKHTRENFPRVQKPTRRYEFGQVRGDIPLAINQHKVNIQRQANLMNDRNVAIFQASLTELDDSLKDFSLQVAKSAHDRALNDEPLTQQESLLLKEIDSLRKGDISAPDYVTRARAIYNLGRADLRISAKPDSAVIRLTPIDEPNSVISPSSPNCYKIDRGQYNLSVQNPGYKTHSRTVTVTDVNSPIAVELEKLRGTLQLRVNPADAEIIINAVSIAAPDPEMGGARSVRIRPTERASSKNLPVGTYNITAKKEGYESITRERVEIKPEVPTEVTLTLMPVAPKPARILGTGLSADVRVFVDGMSVSLPYEVSPGKHRIRLERDGFHPVEISRELVGAQVFSLNPAWTRSNGTLQLRVNPYDAVVTVTPVNIAAQDSEIRTGRDFLMQAMEGRDVPPGTYRVTASKEGYETTIKESVQVRSDDVTEIVLTLKLRISPGGVTQQPRIQQQSVGIRRTRHISQMAAFAASTLVPGLGQHLQGRHQSGVFYEVAVVGAGAATIWSLVNYSSALDDYEDIKTQLSNEAPKQYEITTELSNLENEQQDAYDKAKASRILAIAAQVTLGVVWGINAIDAGLMAPAYQSSGFVFEAQPTSDGGQILVRAPF